MDLLPRTAGRRVRVLGLDDDLCQSANGALLIKSAERRRAGNLRVGHRAPPSPGLAQAAALAPPAALLRPGQILRGQLAF